MLALVLLASLCAVIPCVLFCLNLRQYREPPLALVPYPNARHPERSEGSPHFVSPPAITPLTKPRSSLPAVSVLIPARNEAHGIAAAVQSVLATRNIDFEVIVMDDQSTDSTATIVAELARRDPRVRLEHSAPLPPGWNGKQHACWQLAQAARNPTLCFVDADVRLEPACIARMATLLERDGNSLVSGFPRQVTGTFLEWLLLPLIHFVLLGFLPLTRMRAGTDPAFAAGCGQFLMVNAHDYFRCGGHTQIQLTMHDGLRLPRLFRQHGLRTDLADLTNLAHCRMYTSAAQVWSGLAKNATEGIAAPTRILPISITLLMGQVLPCIPILMLLAILPELTFVLRHHLYILGISHWGAASVLFWLLALLASFLPRVLAVRRFRQDWRSALLHPAGVTILLIIQWYALARQLLGSPVSWKQRAYAQPSPASHANRNTTGQ